MKKGIGKFLSRNKNSDKGPRLNKQQQQQEEDNNFVSNPITATTTENGVDLEVINVRNDKEHIAKCSQEVFRALKQSQQQQQQHRGDPALPEQQDQQQLWGPTVSDTSSTTTATTSASQGVGGGRDNVLKPNKSKISQTDTTEQKEHRLSESRHSNTGRSSSDLLVNTIAADECIDHKNYLRNIHVDNVDDAMGGGGGGPGNINDSMLTQMWQRAATVLGSSPKGKNVTDDAATAAATSPAVPDEPYSIPFMNCLLWVTTPSGDNGCVPITDVFGGKTSHTPAVMTPTRGSNNSDRTETSKPEQHDNDTRTTTAATATSELNHEHEELVTATRSQLTAAYMTDAAAQLVAAFTPNKKACGAEQNVNNNKVADFDYMVKDSTGINDQNQNIHVPKQQQALHPASTRSSPVSAPSGTGAANTNGVPPKLPSFMSRAVAMVGSTGINSGTTAATTGSENHSNLVRTNSKDTNEAFYYKGIGEIAPSSSNLESVNNALHTGNTTNNNNNKTKKISPSGNKGIAIMDKGQPNTLTDAVNGTESTIKVSKAPFALLTLNEDTSIALERDVSELTMRSSYASAMAHYNLVHYGMATVTADSSTKNTKPSPDSTRRMAYYAVGQITQQTSMIKSKNSGGNRRCYFTGKLILGGAPFYAGCVRQGLRTLVVFCLPSALNLPDKNVVAKYRSRLASMKGSKPSSQRSGGGSLQFLSLNEVGTGSSSNSANKTTSNNSKTNNSTGVARTLHLDLSNNSSGGGGGRYRGANGRQSSSRRSMATGSIGGGTHNSASIAAGSQQEYSQVTYGSRVSRYTNNGGTYYDERTIGTGLSIESDLDSNWNIDPTFLLQVLPVAGADLLNSMLTLYKDQFETLPVQVRNASQWKLYIKFCFFSGLPICQEEVHYKVREEIAEQVYYGEEITLSHEVMEACEGPASAELLTLPNRNVLQYIKKHYPQQCSKLDYDERIFQRSSWERMSPEV